MTLRIYCPSCNAEIRTDSDFCPNCGIELNPPENDATRRLETPQRRQTSSSFDSIDNARFVPGAIIAERYRIVGLLGRGGMGEVYRADDLKLSQSVALKFLPSTCSVTVQRSHAFIVRLVSRTRLVTRMSVACITSAK